MTLARTLHTLQTIDLALEAKVKRLQAIQEALGESEALRMARQDLAAAEAELKRWQARQLELDLEVRSLVERIASAERDLMSGRVRNPKELKGMQDNVESMQHHRRELEDQLLEAMVACEEHKARYDQAAAAYQQVEARWRKEQAQLQAEQAQIEAEQVRLQKERQVIIGRLDAARLAAYQQLRQRRGGYAVSEVRRGACQVCGVSLPTSLVQAVRQELELVYCNSCGRILYSPE